MSFEDLRVIERLKSRRGFDPVVVGLSAINALVFIVVVFLILSA